MAHKLKKVWNAKKAMEKLAKEKEIAVRKQQGLEPIRPRYQNILISCRRKIRNGLLTTFCPCTVYDPLRHLRRRRPPKSFCGRLWYDGTYENQVLKAFVGFLGGLVLSLLWLGLMVFYMKYSFLTATVTCSILSLLLSVGLAFSDTVRCLTLLSLPQLFSSKGRAVLVAMCFVLVLNGPVQNFRYNVHVLSGTVTCGQQMATNITKEVVDSALAPVKDIMSSINVFLESLTELAQELRKVVQKIRDLFVEVVEAVKRVFKWLDNMVNVCNKNMGAPYDKCMSGFIVAINDCKSKLGILQGICDLLWEVAKLCEIARVGELLCRIPASVQKHVVDNVTKGIKIALKDMYDMFYFRVNLTYHYDIKLEQSKTYEEVKEDIQRDVEDRIRPLLGLTRISNLGLVIMLAMLVFKAYQYRRKYLTKERHDNFYITWHIRDIETKREERDTDCETILPLNWEEKSKYIPTVTLRLAKSEHRKLIVGLLFLGASGLHLGFQLACDSGLYWLLNMLKVHGELKTTATVPGQVKMHVQGDGVLSDIYRAMITEFDPVIVESVTLDTSMCLPIPSKPDFGAYISIGYIFATCILLQLTQSYGLRMRHIVASCYHPEREKVRAVWLYNHILKRRGGFLTALRRKMKASSKKEKADAQAGFVSLIAAKCPLLGKLMRILGIAKFINCLACSKPGNPSNKTDFIHCDNKGCKAVYCDECYGDLNNLCSACMNPVDYGDFSDISEEKDSSDQAVRRKAKRRLKKLGRLQSSSSSSSSSTSSSSSSSTDSQAYNYQDKKNLDGPATSSSSEDDAYRARRRRTFSRPRPVNLDIFSRPTGRQGPYSSGEDRRPPRVKPMLRA